MFKLKKDRNCPVEGYPMYPSYGSGMMPGMPTPAPMMPMQCGMPMNTSYSTNYVPGDNNSSLTVQVNNLEKRVARL